MTDLALDGTPDAAGLAAELVDFNAKLQAFNARQETPHSPPRPLGEIIADTRRARCGECWQVPGAPCTDGPDGDHVARFGRAFRRGLISGPDLVAVLGTAGVFTLATVIYDPPDGAAQAWAGDRAGGA